MTNSPAATRTKPLLTNTAVVVFALTLMAIMLWSSVSITKLTHAMNVSWWLAWIPAVATDGAMLVATGWCVNHRLEQKIRRYASWIAFTGITGSVAVAAIEHYVTAAGITPRPELGALIGGIPSLMAALLVHVFAMIRNQQKRGEEEVDAAMADLATARGLRAAAHREADEVARIRRATQERERDAAAAHRQALHQDAMDDAERMQHELQQAELEAATAAQQRLRHELHQVAVLQAEVQAVTRAAEDSKAETEGLVAAAEADRERAAHLRSEAEADVAATEDARREAERILSQARRTRERASQVPVSQPPSHRVASVSQLASQSASRAERVDWALRQLRSGRTLRPRDIDDKFGPPRNGAAVLRVAKDRFADGTSESELSAIGGDRP